MSNIKKAQDTDSIKIDSNNYITDKQFIKVRGARTHNLKNIDIDIPRNALVVITGLSGSGKSSLAFDTLYAEGQRRYVESLSAYARQFLQLMEKPDVDLIEGLSPAISIEQKATSHNPRSTVGTVTEIHDYLRLLFARVGTPYCPEHHIPLNAQTISEMVDSILNMPEHSKIMLLAPIVQNRKGEYVDLFAELIAQGFVRFRIQSGGGTKQHSEAKIYEAENLPKLKKTEKHSIDVVIDRIKLNKTSIEERTILSQRLAQSLETALRLADGKVLVVDMDKQDAHQNTHVVDDILLSAKFACPHCNYALSELEPRMFSFNNPIGACAACDGLGQLNYFDVKKIVAFPDLSLSSGAIKGWDKRNFWYFQMLQSLAKHYNFDLDMPFNTLSSAIQQIILHGSTEAIEFSHTSEKGVTTKHRQKFEGIVNNLKRRYLETDSGAVREELTKYQSNQICPECMGSRLRTESRNVRVGNEEQAQTLDTLSRWNLQKTLDYFESIKLKGFKHEVGSKIIIEIISRLRFLINVGLNYLSLNRSADTLSGGEAQRIRLASQIGSGLTGVMYVLDEPSIGLHQRDNDRLIQSLQHLRDLGNSILVVEHDEDMIRIADHVIDIGLGAGVHGGAIIAQGTAAQIAATPASITGQYLNGERKIAIPSKRHEAQNKWLKIQGAKGNNLKSVDIDFPIGLITCITGVSGSGKSTLINDTIYSALANHLHKASHDVAEYEDIQGLEHFDKVINVDQSPIGRTPRSNPATYTGLFTPIRELFAQTNLARERGYQAGRFSFNVKGGRCEACEGDGVIKVEMHFLADMYVPCDVCNSKRYNRETLEVKYKDKNIYEILELTVEDAAVFFENIPTVSRKLQTLLSVGLGYIKLGQAATTLSGGEAQRIKLALELSKRDTGRTLYILDEPTTGLHFYDIQLLLNVLNKLRDAGNTLMIIEHNLDVIKTADYIIDLGPEGGEGGGNLLACGTPEQVAKNKKSITGQYLKAFL
jgi:excinuclease ABC subunit A